MKNTSQPADHQPRMGAVFELIRYEREEEEVLKEHSLNAKRNSLFTISKFFKQLATVMRSMLIRLE